MSNKIKMLNYSALHQHSLKSFIWFNQGGWRDKNSVCWFI